MIVIVGCAKITYKELDLLIYCIRFIVKNYLSLLLCTFSVANFCERCKTIIIIIIIILLLRYIKHYMTFIALAMNLEMSYLASCY